MDEQTLNQILVVHAGKFPGMSLMTMKAQILNLHHDTTPALFSISST